MIHSLRLGLVAATLLCLLGVAFLLLQRVGSERDPAEPVGLPSLASGSAIDWHDCDDRVPGGVLARCAWFDTGVRDGAGNAVRLPLLLIRRDGEPAHGPLTVHLPGGPGAPGGTDSDSAWMWGAWLLSNRFPGRLLVFDPRGTGEAEPRLACPGRQQQVSQMLAQAMSPQEEAAASRDRLAACRQQLLDVGIEPEQFAAHHMLVDVPDILDAMGEHRVRLLGLSHGSRLALALMREHPRRFSAAILDGVFPPHIDPLGSLAEVYGQSLERLFSHCRQQDDCRELELESRFDALYERLAAQPRPVSFLGPGGSAKLIWLDERRFSDIVFAAQAYPESLADLPAAIVAAEGGDFSRLASLLDQVLLPALSPDGNDPVYWASICAEAPAVDAHALDGKIESASHGHRLSPSLWHYHPCDNGWGGQGLPNAFRVPVRVNHRVLLVAGELDPVTPAAWAVDQANRLPDAHLLLARGRTHGLVFSNRCVSEAVMDFLRDPSRSDLPGACPAPRRVFDIPGGGD
ncbi:alpha/beta hydrolase [Natronospira bacteriovora]|uniref:Proline iminopeptidase n=1 Tax=Natronospira bacteriovora TaxID=3069753 RepID=A0ABU0W5S2_9GAMM|nr:alpha/beta fold hydrolase [Natronospira sp. AB-CW4]MDQ2069371.1 alpha/beta fold hydrolase [Natronospira sp. AB-CW4]